MDEFNMNLNDLPEVDNGGFSIIKPGTYNCIVTEASVRDSNNPDNPKYLNLKFEVEDGEELGNTFYASLNCFHRKSEKARSIANQHVRLLMEALGIKTTRTTDDLIGARARLTVEHRSFRGRDGEERTTVDVKRWERPSAPTTSAAPTADSVTPPWLR